MELPFSSFERYQRQLLLPDFDLHSQNKLYNSTICLIGVGGLGCAILPYLISCGVGKIIIVDGDVVEKTNLARQVLYNENDVGRNKTDVVAEKMKMQNSDVSLEYFDEFISEINIENIISSVDLVIDGSDNFKTRYLLSDFCFKKNIPYAFAALYKNEGQLAILMDKKYSDIFPESNKNNSQNCAEAGVLGTHVSIVGSFLANEIIKFLSGSINFLRDEMLIINSTMNQFYKIKF